MTQWCWMGIAFVCGAAGETSQIWKIHLSQDAPEPVCFAAEELSRYGRRIFGQPFPLLRCAVLGENTLFLSRCKGIPCGSDGGSSGQGQRKPEEIVIRSTTTGIFFQGGTPRATLYAVYTFLEDHLGCRWYTPDPEDQIVPRHPLSLLEEWMSREECIMESPEFPFRQREFRDVSPNMEGTEEKILQQIDWCAKLRMNRFLINFGYARDLDLWNRWKSHLFPEIKKRGLLLGLGEHGSYPLFLPPGRYAEEHPAWYCEIDGTRVRGFQSEKGQPTQFCTTHPDALATYLDHFEAFAVSNPEIDTYYPAPNDMGLWCTCQSCRDIPVADRYMDLNNAIAERLSSVRASYEIIHLAYANHRNPPQSTSAHPNVLVDVACWGRDFQWPLSDSRTMLGRGDYLTVFEEWKERCRGPRPRLVYHCKLMRHLWLTFHPLPLDVLDADFEQVKSMDLDGFDFPLGFVGIWTKAPNAYAVARKSWDTRISSALLRESFLKTYYGNSAPGAERVMERVREALPSLQYGSNNALVWQSRFVDPHGEAMPELKDDCERAVGFLMDAVDIAVRTAEKEMDVRVRTRLLWLEKAVRQLLGEQRVLLKIAEISEVLFQWQSAREEDRSDALRERILNTARSLCGEALLFARAYSPEDDLAGLLWLGNTHETLSLAAERWRYHAEMTVAGRDWHLVGRWHTEEFPNSQTVIIKEVEVTHLLKEPGPVFVRWKWVGGEVGVDILETSLWEIIDGDRICLNEDTHKGFTGWQDRSSMYSLHISEIRPTARYLIQGRLRAYTTRGDVRERGSEGEVYLGM